MAGAQISIEADVSDVLATLSALQAAAGNTQGLWQDAGEYLLQSHRERFDRAETADGQPWAPLSARYQRRKKRRADQILVLDAFLRDQLAYHASADGLDLGSNRIYAATHQFGAEDRGIPARPFLGLSDDDRAEILELAKQHLSAATSPTA